MPNLTKAYDCIYEFAVKYGNILVDLVKTKVLKKKTEATAESTESSDAAQPIMQLSKSTSTLVNREEKLAKPNEKSEWVSSVNDVNETVQPEPSDKKND